MRFACGLVVCLCLVVASGAWGSDDRGVVNENVDLHTAPTTAADAPARLAAGTEVFRLQRQGGWIEVRAPADNVAGWIRVWHFRPADTASPEAETAETETLSGLRRFSRQAAGLFSTDDTPTASDDVTATIGVRGLGIGDAEDARPDPGARTWVDNHRVRAADAEAFAREAGLRPRSIDTSAVPPGRDQKLAEVQP